jgi:hypothetical protein
VGWGAVVTAYEAACELIREIDINRETHDAHRDTETDHRALYAARERFDELREAQ